MVRKGTISIIMQCRNVPESVQLDFRVSAHAIIGSNLEDYSFEYIVM